VNLSSNGYGLTNATTEKSLNVSINSSSEKRANIGVGRQWRINYA
jgi:hypothetical protein